MKKTILFVLAMICAMQLYSVTYAVYTVSSTGNNSGTSYTTIKAAITAAASGDTIKVAAETFTEKNITFPTISSVVTPKSITIKGAGMSKTIVQAFATPFNTAASNSSVFNLDGAYSSAITVTIQDMTIQNGYTSSNGGGIRITKTGTVAPTLNLTNLKIANNNSVAGGGVYISGEVNLTINGCNITGNTMTSSTGQGGGIFIIPGTVYPVNATIKNSTISFNSSVSNGGGIMVLCGTNGATPVAHSLTLENTTIYKNSCTVAAKLGGGIDFRMGGSGQTAIPTHTVTLNHCTVVGNTTNAAAGADGVCFENGAYQVTLVMNNSIVMGNSGSTTNISQIGIAAASQLKLTNGGVNNNIIGIITSGTWATGTNNTVCTPATTGSLLMSTVLSNLAFPTLDNNALSLDPTPVLLIGPTSSAKDYVATNSLSLTTDQIGNQRDVTPDAGAYEYNASLAIAASSLGGSVTSGTGNFASGASTTLVAAATGSNVFGNWTENGVVVSTNPSYTFTVTRARTLVANFVVQYNVQTANDGNGNVTGAATVASGSPVTLTATPNAGYAFSAWTVTAGTAPTPSATSTWTFTPSASCTITASFVSITALTPTVTYARTATTIDVLVTNPIGYTGTLTYNVLDGSDAVLATGVAATLSPQTATLAYSATGLSANSSYTYKVVAVINGNINSATATVTALTRKQANGTVQVIDDFENANAMGWINQSSAVLTIPYTNTVTDGINASTNCAKANIPAGSVSYAGFTNSYERFEVGPNAPYQYLHIKMYRDADNGKLALTFIKRNDITLAQLAAAETPTVSTVSASGPWVDYVFDLKNAAYTVDKTFFGFYIKPNFTNPSNTGVESNCYIDDIYLSNDATASTANITIPVTISAGSNGTISQTSNSYLSGATATVVATPNSGYVFVNWTDNSTQVSTNASYSFTVSAARTLVANFTADLNTGINANVATNQFVVAKESIVSNVSGAIQIYSISGKMITNQPLTVGQVIPMTAGSYIVRVITNNEVFVKKISF